MNAVELIDLLAEDICRIVGLKPGDLRLSDRDVIDANSRIRERIKLAIRARLAGFVESAPVPESELERLNKVFNGDLAGVVWNLYLIGKGLNHVGNDDIARTGDADVNRVPTVRDPVYLPRDSRGEECVDQKDADIGTDRRSGRVDESAGRVGRRRENDR